MGSGVCVLRVTAHTESVLLLSHTERKDNPWHAHNACAAYLQVLLGVRDATLSDMK
jgi:hypothetical protein